MADAAVPGVLPGGAPRRPSDDRKLRSIRHRWCGARSHRSDVVAHQTEQSGVGWACRQVSCRGFATFSVGTGADRPRLQAGRRGEGDLATSKRTLARHVRNALGKTPISHVKDLRVERRCICSKPAIPASRRSPRQSATPMASPCYAAASAREYARSEETDAAGPSRSNCFAVALSADAAFPSFRPAARSWNPARPSF